MEQQINLYQPILRAEKRLFSAAAIAAGLGLLVAALGVLAGYAAWHTRRAEATLADVERQAAERQARVDQSRAASGAASDPVALEREIVALTEAIAARERALAAIGHGPATAGGFAAALEALARPAPEGLWLRRIVVDPARGLALEGLVRDPRLVPAYLGALAPEQALAGKRFADFELHRARADAQPAVATFTVAAPGLAQALATDPFKADDRREDRK
jgi:hypothetical protein